MKAQGPISSLRSGLSSLFERGRGRLKHLLARGQTSETPQRRLGRRAEGEAARFLKKKGYRILERNFRCREGEIDLVVFKSGVVAFVEVRSRTEPVGLDPLYTVTRRKQQRLIRAAQQYMSLRDLHGEDVVLRFDVVALRYARSGTVAQITHIEGAFTL